MSEGDYDALVLPGGQINPDLLRVDEPAMGLIKGFISAGRALGAREVTSYPSIRRDVENAGGKWVDSEVACENGIVTSRKPDDLDAFVAKVAEEIAEGTHERKAA